MANIDTFCSEDFNPTFDDFGDAFWASISFGASRALSLEKILSLFLLGDFGDYISYSCIEFERKSRGGT